MTKKQFLQLNFQEELKINKYKLDEECLTHASRYAFYAEACADAKTNATKAKDNLELVMAERNVAIREELSKSDKKVTEAMINANILKDEEVLKAKAELRDAEDVCSKLDVAVKSFDARKSELDNLTKLYCAGYFSNIESSKGRSTVNENVSKEMRKNLNR